MVGKYFSLLTGLNIYLPLVANDLNNFLRGAIKKKRHKKWKTSKNEKVQNSKFGLLDKRGGDSKFSGFPQILDFKCFS